MCIYIYIYIIYMCIHTYTPIDVTMSVINFTSLSTIVVSKPCSKWSTKQCGPSVDVHGRPVRPTTRDVHVLGARCPLLFVVAVSAVARCCYMSCCVLLLRACGCGCCCVFAPRVCCFLCWLLSISCRLHIVTYCCMLLLSVWCCCRVCAVACMVLPVVVLCDGCCLLPIAGCLPVARCVSHAALSVVACCHL